MKFLKKYNPLFLPFVGAAQEPPVRGLKTAIHLHLRVEEGSFSFDKKD